MVVEYKRTLEGNYMVIREVEEKNKRGGGSILHKC